MPIALAASKTQPEVNDSVAITGTGFTNSGNVNITVTQEGAEDMSFTVTLVASAGGAISGLTIVPGRPGLIDVAAHDVTANTDTSLQLQVFET